MRILQPLILAAGLATMALLLWRLDPAAVWSQMSCVGWGFLVIFSFQLFDHMLNALGWRFAFGAEDARRLPFWRLVKVRIAGDGVNYLTPSGTIAGELIRPALLGDAAPEAAKNSSVAVAKFAQALGQMAFILIGLIFVLLGRFHFIAGRELALSLFGTLSAMAFIAGALYFLTSSGGWTEPLWRRSPKISRLRDEMRGYLRKHPGRFMSSTVCFMLGYAWGGLEVLLICYFMGISITPVAALAVEVFSNLVDSMTFFVPAKIGTQEASKTAIFSLLGYRASQGLSFGLIRHTREILWACLGLALYALSRRPAGLPPRPRGISLPPSAPLTRAD